LVFPGFDLVFRRIWVVFLGIGWFGYLDFRRRFQWIIGTSKYANKGGACNRKYAETSLKKYMVETWEIP